MSSTLLSTLSIALDYVWSPDKKLRALVLDLHPETSAPIDIPLLLRVLDDTFHGPAPTLILRTRNSALMRDLVLGVHEKNIWIMVPETSLLSDEVFLAQAQEACQNGAQLVWSGKGAEQPHESLQGLYMKHFQNFKPERMRMIQRAGNRDALPLPNTAVRKDQISAGIDNEIFLIHCIEEKKVWGVAGWPFKPLVQQMRAQSSTPSYQAVANMSRAIEKEASIEKLEYLLGQDPILAYRFIRFVNSVVISRGQPIESLRRGLAMVGLSKVGEWLDDQLIGAVEPGNLDPLRVQMVFRAMLTEYLLDPGADQELKAELYLCGLFSQLDILLNELMPNVLQRIPLPERVLSAIGGRRGVYWVALDMAFALESGDAVQVSQRGITHGTPPSQVNKALLRVLSGLSSITPVQPLL